MDATMLKQLDQWHQDDEHKKIIQAIHAIPPAQWDYDLVCRLARAYNNLDEYEEGIRQLRTVEEQGRDDPLWHYRLGYAYYYLGKIKQAREAFLQAQRLNPDDEDTKLFLQWCSNKANKGDAFYKANSAPADAKTSQRSGGRRKLPVSSAGSDLPPNSHTELYERAEVDAVDAHIVRWFGKYAHVFHEINSPDIHVDIAIVEPSEERPYYTLVTMGMGAHRMTVPPELKGKRLDRAEMVICLPPDWDINNSDERWYWPLRWLKILARLPGNEDSWLGWGHTVAAGNAMADNTDLASVILTWPWLTQERAQQTRFFGSEDAAVCKLPNGEEVRFFQVVPIFEQEMNYKLGNRAETLLELFDEEMPIALNPKRRNYCAS